MPTPPFRAATIVGLQWGDEGKGKVLDAVGGEADMVVRYQGGGNAGHTVIVGGKKYVFHLVPTGILRTQATCVIGNGAVVDVLALQDEITKLEAEGIDLSNLKLSQRAHVVLPYHRALDEAREERRSGGQKIGTTKRGIGPCYADKASRHGIRVVDLFDPPAFAARLRHVLDEKNAVLTQLFGRPPLEYQPVHDACLEAAEALRPYVADTTTLVLDALDAGKKVLFEGAQGVMLDVDHGTYPYVTSSHASSAGVPAGAGVPPAAVGNVLGIMKAYTTRVGAGPFPTELEGDAGERLRQAGHEFGATTGRPRRCGWLDLVQLRYAVRRTGTTGLVLTKLDTLGGFGPLQVAIGYRIDGQEVAVPPADPAAWERIEPIYEQVDGIPADIDWSAARSWSDLPAEALAYIAMIEERLGASVAYVSVGPEREALIERAGGVVFSG